METKDVKMVVDFPTVTDRVVINLEDETLELVDKDKEYGTIYTLRYISKSGAEYEALSFEIIGTIQEQFKSYKTIIGICEDDGKALLNQKHENDDIKKLSDMKLLDFPKIVIDVVCLMEEYKESQYDEEMDHSYYLNKSLAEIKMTLEEKEKMLDEVHNKKNYFDQLRDPYNNPFGNKC